MLQAPGVTERLAALCRGHVVGRSQAAGRHQAKRSLMNFFAVALTGCRDQTIEIALQTLARVLRRQAGDDRRARASASTR